ncbi:gas vesicle protein GvpG [Sphaerisporangium fuscum]|uniref:gas vesicle protein GvpG n=1 Tax=Sphaerisporangium fuscum TaxID=2835868 RepID=UPI001BDD30A9|nr:gas vesicle protein GvpG [Sphaerisporangium fuscum]
MGVFKLLFGWPLAPVELLIKLGELIERQVDTQLHDPASIRRQLEEVDEARAEGRISEEEASRATEEILQRMMA